MISVEDARARILALAAPLGTETVSLLDACGRVLAEPVIAQRTQPPFAASAMDGYAVRAQDCQSGAQLAVIGEVAAGTRSNRKLGPGEAMRIFTGAPLPAGADAVLIQEDAQRIEDSASAGAPRITATTSVAVGENIRRPGIDFETGETGLEAPKRLTPRDIALAAAMGHAWLSVYRAPRVALLALGDELRLPGEALGDAQIVSSNNFALAAQSRAWGADPWLLPIVPDDLDALIDAIRVAASADLLLTLGGASVGDHDLARPAFASLGMTPDFYKIAMRPGKPLMAGRLPANMGGKLVLGLPGNPVSAMVCAELFLRPALERLQGLPGTAPTRVLARLAHDLPANGPREHYMRGLVERIESESRVTVFESQDSSRLSLLSRANALAVRPPQDAPRKAGDVLECIIL
ncbi:MAG: molybdopterin molybdotransferase MoeA [Neomegalonema sp.]|nr:molybdopterin molybdotransferase MoeA [Neomegalonema sp.]